MRLQAQAAIVIPAKRKVIGEQQIRQRIQITAQLLTPGRPAQIGANTLALHMADGGAVSQHNKIRRAALGPPGLVDGGDGAAAGLLQKRLQGGTVG